jgi:peptidoglycan/LPS O-acetylase OafA/YrhL
MWALVVLFLPRRFLPTALIAMVVIGPVVRLAMARHGFWGEMELVTPAAFDSLGWGCLLAYGWRRWAAEPARLDRAMRIVLAAAGVLFVAERIADVTGHYTLTVDAVSNIWFPLISVWAVHRAARGINGPVGMVLSSRPVVHIGVVSYGVYLLHLFVMPLAEEAHQRLPRLPVPEQRGLVQFVFVTTLTLLVASASWTFFESPLNRMKHRFPYVRPRTQPSPAVAPS